MKYISLTIDDQTITVPAGSTLLAAARRLGISIPTLCHFAGQKTRAVCRICSVQRADNGRMVPACATPVEEGMQIETDNDAVVAARRTLMEFILAEHGRCGEPNCAVEQLAEQLGVSHTRFEAPSRSAEVNRSSDFVMVHPERCIHCDRCVEACGKDQRVIARAGRGATVAVVFDDDRSMGDSSCTGCGDCVAVCPAGGLLEAV